jgi:hypothetical protein
MRRAARPRFRRDHSGEDGEEIGSPLIVPNVPAMIDFALDHEEGAMAISLGRGILVALCGAVIWGLLAPQAGAQATRTWVSGTGDDSNPCSLTAPCHTFAGAIGKTAVGGEINALDSGGFGALTITHSITIRAVGVEAGVLTSGTNGITISAPAGVVNLIGLDLFSVGSNTGLAGVSILSAAKVFIANSDVRNYGTGISLAPTSSKMTVTLKDSTVSNNSTGVAVSASSVSATVLLDHATLVGNGIGVSEAVLNNSTIFGSVKSLSTTSNGKILSFANNRITDPASTVTPSHLPLE